MSFTDSGNIINCLYGPPIKQKYKCSECGFIWITGCLGGLDDVHYCPQCGKEPISMIERQFRDHCFGVGKEEPYDPAQAPILATEKQLIGLLSQRDGKERYYCEPDLLWKMKNAGFDIPQNQENRHPRTEAESDRIYHAQMILNTKGNDVNAFPNTVCDRCGSKYIAALVYKKIRATEKPEDCIIAETASSAPLVVKIFWESPPLRYGKTYEKYVCLQCGKKFGEKTFDENDPAMAEYLAAGKADDLFDQAVEVKKRKGKISADILEHELRIGYYRSIRIADAIKSAESTHEQEKADSCRNMPDSNSSHT